MKNPFNNLSELYEGAGITMSIILTMFLLIVIPSVVIWGVFQLITTPIYYVIVMLTTNCKDV